MQSSEKKSLHRFLLIYILSTLTLFTIGLVIFYQYELFQIRQKEEHILNNYSHQMSEKIRHLHKSSEKPLLYPNDPQLKTAIYDIDKGYIFGSFHPKTINWNQEYTHSKKTVRHIVPISPYYLGVAYLITERGIDQKPIQSLRRVLILVALGTTLLVVILSYFLGRLFIAPMRDSLARINRFVQDTTHELNTPISTILTNIEMLDILGKCKNNNEIKRIEIASKTLSHIYDDLAYLNLNQTYQRHIKPIDIAALLHERLDYFSGMIETKKLLLTTNITPKYMQSIDANDALRLFDNIISNAIKYNHVGGTLNVQLDRNLFRVTNSGRGMSKKELAGVCDRFQRIDTSEGGFGIGLSIVSHIADYYRFSVRIDSEEGKNTTIQIIWNTTGELS